MGDGARKRIDYAGRDVRETETMSKKKLSVAKIETKGEREEKRLSERKSNRLNSSWECLQEDPMF